MTDLQSGMKISFVQTYKRYQVLVAKRGDTGTIVEPRAINIYLNGLPQKVSGYLVDVHGEQIEVPDEYIAKYEKKTKRIIEKLPNDELLKEFESLIREEVHAPSTTTKSYEKILSNLDRCKTELLKRLGE